MAGSSDLSQLMEMVHWLVRLRIPNECFIVNRVNLAAMIANNFPGEYQAIKESLPPWILFYNLAGYAYYPEERVNVHEVDVRGIAQKAGVDPVRSLGKVSAFDFLKLVQAPSADPYWKLRSKGGSQDIFCMSNFQNVSELVNVMYKLADKSGYPATEMGVYVQPLVQGANYHVEFNLFYNPQNPKESATIRELVTASVNPLIAAGGFFSRPYGEIARSVLNKDAATVQALRKVKSILDPDNIMNPGKLCF
jgi:hypothetical protein